MKRGAKKHGAARDAVATRPLGRREPILLAVALEMARLVDEVLAAEGLGPAVVVGDVRRGVELVDVLTMIAPAGQDARAFATVLERVEACDEVALESARVARAHFNGGGTVLLRSVPPGQFVEALVRDTGTAAHVRWLESLAQRADGLSAACARAGSEENLYELLGVPFAPPELREGPTPHVPDLVSEVSGVFHVHTTWSDGTDTIVEMARAAQRAGLAFLGVSEHSKAASYAGGLDAARLREQARAMAAARREVPELALLHGVEVDIMPDGSLDLDDATLATLDFVIASVHVEMDMDGPAMTRRLLRALSHPLVTILGHPTGRLLLGRKGSAFDLDAVARAAAAQDTLLEINANPQRLDLSDALARQAAASGARFVIDPDAHSARGMTDAGLGVTVARRAGLAPSQVLNAGSAGHVAKHLTARRKKARQAIGLA